MLNDQENPMHPAGSSLQGNSRVCIVLHFLFCLALSCGAIPASGEETDYQGWEEEAKQTVEKFEAAQPELRAFFEKSHAYAVYPKIRKLAYALGIAGGHGTVFQGGDVVGYSRLTQVTYGFTLGVHSFREVIFFRNEEVFDQFKSGTLDLDAQASAIVGSAAAMASYDFDSDVLVYTITNTGLMFDLSLGGQKFSFEPR